MGGDNASESTVLTSLPENFTVGFLAQRITRNTPERNARNIFWHALGDQVCRCCCNKKSIQKYVTVLTLGKHVHLRRGYDWPCWVLARFRSSVSGHQRHNAKKCKTNHGSHLNWFQAGFLCSSLSWQWQHGFACFHHWNRPTFCNRPQFPSWMFS